MTKNTFFTTENVILRTVAAMDVAGRLMTDSKRLTDASLRGKALASRVDLANFATTASPAEKQVVSEALGIDDWTKLDADSFNKKIVEFVENGGVERYKQLRELIKNADALSEADARPMPKFMNMQKDGIRRYSDENSRIAVMKNGDTYRLYDYDLRTVSKELTRSEVNAALREYNTKKNAVTSMNQESMQVTENNSAIDPGSKRMALPENISAYSDEEINSIESRKENIVARSYNDVLEFFEYAVSDQSNEGKTMFIGKISNKTAAKIRKETGMNAFGKSIALNSHDIRHMMKEHGNAKTEAMRNQEAITTENFGHVIETIANPDKITASKDEKSGVTSLIFEKEIAGKTTAITIFSEKRKTLTLKTAWIIKKEQHISQPTNAEALIRTPEARSSMDAVPTDSIPQNTEKVNTSDEKNISKVQAVEKSAAELDSIAKENIPEYSKLSVPTRVMIRKVLYDALAVGYSEYDAIMFSRVSARSGLHMTFSKSLCLAGRIKGTKDLVHADGYYDPYGNRIVINPEGTRSVDALLIHELTHAIYKDKRGRIILERGAKNMSDEQKQSIIKSYSKVAKGSSAVIMDEMNAHYIEGQLKNKNLLEALLSDEPTLKDKILSFFKGASTDYAGNAELSGAAKRLFKRYKKLFDSFSAQNQDTNAYGAAVMNSAEQSGDNSKIFALGVTQKDIDEYVDNAYEKKNDKDYKKYAVASPKLIEDVSDEIDISGYSHALRDNDIRHINYSHGEGNPNEKYPVTRHDIKMIPTIVSEYDKVIVFKKSSTKEGLMYVKVTENGLVYYLEQITSQYGNEKLLVNKQMIKTGINDIPDIKGLKDAITKKQSETEFLADLKARQVYAQSVRQFHSTNSISEKSQNVNTNSEKNSSKRFALPEGTDVENVEMFPGESERNYMDRMFSVDDEVLKLESIKKKLKNEVWELETKNRKLRNEMQELQFGKKNERNFNETSKEERQALLKEKRRQYQEVSEKLEKKSRILNKMDANAHSFSIYDETLRRNLKNRYHLEGIIAANARAMKDLKLGKFHNATQAENDTFKKTIMSLGRIDFRGNMNQGGTRKILSELKEWRKLT